MDHVVDDDDNIVSNVTVSIDHPVVDEFKDSVTDGDDDDGDDDDDGAIDGISESADLVLSAAGVGEPTTADNDNDDTLFINKLVLLNNDDDGNRRTLLPAVEKKRKPTKTKKKPKQRAKKPPDAPKRFKSSFIFFSMEKHKEIKGKMATGVDPRPANITAMVSEAWRTIDPLEKEKFEELARHDKTRYDLEKRNYVPPPGTFPDSKRKREPGAPKRPMSAYFSFANKIRGRVKAENAGCSNGEISKILSAMWKELPDEERREYKDGEQSLWGTYREEMVEWKKKNDGRKKEKKEAKRLRHSHNHQYNKLGREDAVKKRLLDHTQQQQQQQHAPTIGSIEFPGHAVVDGDAGVGVGVGVDEPLLCLGGVSGIDTNPNTDEMMAASALRGVRGGPQQHQHQHQHQHMGGGAGMGMGDSSHNNNVYGAFFGVNANGGANGMNQMLGGGTQIPVTGPAAYGQIDMSGFPYGQYNYPLGGNAHAMIMAQLRGAPHQQYSGWIPIDQQANLTQLASLAGVQNDAAQQQQLQQQQQQMQQQQQDHLQQSMDQSVPDNGLDMGMGNTMRNVAIGNAVVNDAPDGGIPF